MSWELSPPSETYGPKLGEMWRIWWGDGLDGHSVAFVVNEVEAKKILKALKKTFP